MNTMINIREVGKSGDKVRFKGQAWGNSYTGIDLKVNQSADWGLIVDNIYTVGEVIESGYGNVIYKLAGTSMLVDASCFELVE